jgi:hypothetical protein
VAAVTAQHPRLGFVWPGLAALAPGVALQLGGATALTRASIFHRFGLPINPMKYATLLLSLIVLASITAGRATTNGCAVVLNTPDGFLAIREGPGTQFRIKDKLKPSQEIGIPTEHCTYRDNGNVTCPKWIRIFRGDYTEPGWVRSKYIQLSNCSISETPLATPAPPSRQKTP